MSEDETTRIGFNSKGEETSRQTVKDEPTDLTVSAIKLVTNVYANIREEIGIIRELAGDTYEEALENVKAGCLVVDADKEKVIAECCAISLQLQLLDSVDTPSDVRVQETERQAREWAYLLETAGLV